MSGEVVSIASSGFGSGDVVGSWSEVEGGERRSRAADVRGEVSGGSSAKM